MRTIDDYMKLPYRMEIVEDTDEGGYVVSFPDLKGCIVSLQSFLKMRDECYEKVVKKLDLCYLPLAIPAGGFCCFNVHFRVRWTV